MNNVDEIVKLANSYYYNCQVMIKEAFIRKMPNGKYRVLSEKGRNLGEYSSRKGAQKRLRQIEFFKHRDANKSDDSSLDLSDIDDFSYSAIMRKLNKKGTSEQLFYFLNLYKLTFDKAVKDKIKDPEKIALKTTFIKFCKKFNVIFDKKIIKSAETLGNTEQIGRYLADIVRFTLGRISPKNRAKSINNLRNKFLALSELEISSKHLPASSALGQSITFVKHVLFGHNPKYVRDVLNAVARYL
jgi:hypothetical protein